MNALRPGAVLLAVRPFSGGRARSHALLQQLAASCAPPERLTLAFGPHGKPFFPDCPSLRFSISHSGGLWLCALSSQEVGLDVQRQDARPWQAMAERYFHPNEAAFVRARGETAFFEVWSARESYLKYRGTGLLLPARHFSTVDAAGRFPSLPDAFLTRPAFRPGFSLFLCTEKQPEELLWL